MHYILLTFPSTAILWGAYSNEVCVRFDRYFPVPNQRHGKAEEGRHHLQGRQEAVTGKLPIQVHLLWRHWGRRQESVLSELMKTPEKHKADVSVQGDLPCEKGKCLCFTALCPVGLFCPVGSGSGCKAGWDQIQAWVSIWWLWISLFFLFCFFFFLGTLIHTSDLLWGLIHSVNLGGFVYCIYTYWGLSSSKWDLEHCLIFCFLLTLQRTDVPLRP